MDRPDGLTGLPMQWKEIQFFCLQIRAKISLSPIMLLKIEINQFRIFYYDHLDF